MSDDTDDQIHEEVLLASAYLDGAATPDERALVETSPQTMADVDALAQVRTVLSATAPVASLSEREAHLAGALDVWERMSDLERSGEATPAAGVDAAAAAAVLTPTSTSEGRGRGRGKSKRSGSLGSSQWLLGAAAALVLIAGTAAVVRGIIAQDPETNEAAVESVTDQNGELSDVEQNEAAEVNGENVGDDGVLDPDVIEGQAQADPGGDDGLFPTEAASDEFETDSVEEAGDVAADDAGAPAEQPAPAPEIERDDLETLEDLADYGALVVRAIDAELPVPSVDFDAEPPGGSCEDEFGIEKLLAPARYQGEDVFVGVDTDNEIVFAYTGDDIEGCTLVASVPLPTTQP